MTSGAVFLLLDFFANEGKNSAKNLIPMLGIKWFFMLEMKSSTTQTNWPMFLSILDNGFVMKGVEWKDFVVLPGFNNSLLLYDKVFI